MKREYKTYLEDILECIERIEEYVDGMNDDDFYENCQAQDAVLRRLEIIGEAVKRMPQHIKNEYPTIPWRKIAGLRDVLIHGYSSVNLKRVWKIIIENLPELKLQIIEVIETGNKNEIE